MTNFPESLLTLEASVRLDSNPARRVFTNSPAVRASVITALTIRARGSIRVDHCCLRLTREQLMSNEERHAKFSGIIP
jgi:hypothetical protein